MRTTERKGGCPVLVTPTLESLCRQLAAEIYIQPQAAISLEQIRVRFALDEEAGRRLVDLAILNRVLRPREDGSFEPCK